MELTAGTVLLGKYRVEEIIGSGGMGRVVRASHLYLQQPVAIKILLEELTESESTVARFLREAQSTVKLRSEHIARVMDVGTLHDGTPLMVMEFLDGNDLNQILRHHGPQAPAVVVDLMLQACEGMAEAHQLGIVHRDIKPSNFFITRRPDGTMLLKILDFGISKSPAGVDELTNTQTVLGTPSYMAPEQMKSGKIADPRSDVWSMGVVMYQLLCGRPPFVGESFADLVLKVGLEPPSPIMVPLPPGLGEVILRCLEKDLRFRLQSVGELARMLAPFASDPINAAQSAARTMRTLQRGGLVGQQGSPFAAGGGLTAPVPLSPAQLTPRSWPPSSTGSQIAGQVTLKTRGRKGWLIAGAISLVIVAGAGGYIVSELARGKKHAKEPAAATTEPAHAAVVAAPPVIAPDAGVAVAATVPIDAAPVVVATVPIDAAPAVAIVPIDAAAPTPIDAAPKVVATVPIDAAAAPIDAAPAATVVTSHPSGAGTSSGSAAGTKAPPKVKKPKDDDLFGSRH